MNRFRITPLLLLAGCAIGVGLGCRGEVYAVDLVAQTGAFTLDPGRLRPDFEPLNAQTQSGDRATYSDGNEYTDLGQVVDSGGSAPLSPLRIADIDGDLNDQLQRAACLWVDQGNTTARISYEVIAYDVELPEVDSAFEQFSGCGGMLGDPDTRGAATYVDQDSGEITEIPGDANESVAVELTIRTGTPRRDPHHACDADDPGIASQPVRVVNLSGVPDVAIRFPEGTKNENYPFCMNQGALPPVDEDWSLQLDLIDPITGSPFADLGVDAPPFEIPTRVKVVPPSRAASEFLISRPLKYYGAREGRVSGDRTITPFSWTWRAGVLGDGRWEENFSPNLAISRIRVFRDLGIDPDTGEMIREYLPAQAVEAYSNTNLLRGGRETRCNFNRGETGEDPPACLDAVGFTPTYRIDRMNLGTRLTELLTWVIDFNEVVECQPFTLPDGTMDCMDVLVQEPPADPSDSDLYVEFHLVNPSISSSGRGLLVSPAASDFGDVEAGNQPLFDDVFEISNVGGGAIRITDIVIEGPDAGDFEIVPDGQPLVGRRIETGQGLPVDLRVVSASRHNGRREAMLRIVAEDLQGNPMTVRANLRATVVDWVFEALHAPYHFIRYAGQDQWDDVLQFQKALLIVNAGTFEMPRGQISIVGPGAAHWSIAREKSEFLPPADYIPWLRGEAPDAVQRIAPGSSELFWVVYHPDVPYLRRPHHGADEAEIRIQVDDAEYTIPLVGNCDGKCEFRAPMPYAPPGKGGGVLIDVGTQVPAMGSGGLIPVESRLVVGG